MSCCSSGSSCSSCSSRILPKSDQARGLRERAFSAQNRTQSQVELRIPGYLVNPVHLVELLQERFQGHYKVKLRNDNYFISIPEKLTQNDLVRCY
ncbi:hypothetical protein K445DRAFT_323014 [Daldinia sp. EC12]|nr:hypothetical protein K445DRAFT_323014 [Daldinia sp. EC12]